MRGSIRLISLFIMGYLSESISLYNPKKSAFVKIVVWIDGNPLSQYHLGSGREKR
jgi:hypothetical protein